MPPWLAHVRFDPQTVLIVVGVVLGVIIVGCVLYILYDEPPDPERRKPKAPSLPYAPPPPQGVTLGPRFAQIEAWKREQEGDRPFLPGVPRLGATPPASSAPPAADPPPAEDREDEDWLNDRARALSAEEASSSAAPAAGAPEQKAAVQQPEEVPDEALEAPPASEAVPAAASDVAEEAVSSLRPVQPGELAELEAAADQTEESARLTEEEAEGAEEDLPSLHPVHLDWIMEDLWESSAAEDEALVPGAASEQQFAEQVSPSPTMEAAPTGAADAPDTVGEAEPAILETAEEHKAAWPLAIQAFGRAQLVVFGRPLEQRVNNRLELLLYLAHHAAQGERLPAYVDRYTLSDALWGNVTQPLESLRTAKSRLLDDLEGAGVDLQQYPCLETGPEDSLRLHPAVHSDLHTLLTLGSQLDQARKAGEHASSAVSREQLENWQASLEHLYRGGFALQLKDKPWAAKARRLYHLRYAQARFDLARLWAQLGLFRQAVDLGTETVLQVSPTPEGMMRVLVGWVQRQEPIDREQWATHFAQEYERHYRRTLAQANAALETLRQSVLPTR